MRGALGLWVVLSLPALFGCSSISVSSDYDESADFSELRTFAWMLESKGGHVDVGVEDPLIRSRIQIAIARELEAKGYRHVAEEPDFEVTYHARTQEKIHVQSVPRAGPMVGPRWGGTYTEVYQYDEGTLIIDVIHTSTQRLLWRGTAKAAVDWQASPEARTALINEAVQKTLAEFPPKRSR